MRRTPYLLPWVVGLGLRAIAALCGYGWFAADDYAYVIQQGSMWLADPHAAFTSDLRSALFPRAFWLLMLGAHKLGATNPAATLRCAYLGLGVYSSLIIPGVGRLAERLGPDAARTAAWLAACFALMPHLGTRALVESAAMVPLVWGAWWLDRARHDAERERPRAGLLAGLLLGAATLLRFQVGVVFLPAVVLVVAVQRGWPRGEPLRAGLAVMAGGCLAALAQAGIDLSMGRPPFGTLVAYLTYNLQHAAQFGVSPWYTYTLQFLLFTVPPASLFLLRPLWVSARLHAVASVLWAVFVAMHSLIGHKEDRFMFPVLPLFLVLLAGALVLANRGGYASRAAVRLFWLVNGVALGVATFSDGQRSVTDPLLAIQRGGGGPRVAAVGVGAVPMYYLTGAHASVREFDSVQALVGDALQSGAPVDYVLMRPPPNADTLAHLERVGCREPVLYEGDWVDRLLVRVNRHNERRAATALVPCRGRSVKTL